MAQQQPRDDYHQLNAPQQHQQQFIGQQQQQHPPPNKKPKYNSSNSTITQLLNAGPPPPPQQQQGLLLTTHHNLSSTITTGTSINQSSPQTPQQQHQQFNFNTNTNTTNNTNNNSQSQSNDNTNNINNDDYTPVFYDEIKQILRAYGDSENCIRDTVILVEKIVHQQLCGIFQEILDVAFKRCGKPEPRRCDFEQLLINNPIKLSRFQQYMINLKTRRKLQCLIQTTSCDNSNPSSASAATVPTATTTTATINSTIDDLIDEPTAEMLPIKYDEERTRRLFRFDKISQILDNQQYKNYNAARRTTFLGRHNAHLIRKWLNIADNIRLTPNINVMISYLAHETIATIVDYSILTRLHSNNRITDPFCRITSTGASPALIHLCPEVTQGRGLDGIKPITVQEVQEAMRRHTMGGQRKTMGLYRNLSNNQNYKIPYLAI